VLQTLAFLLKGVGAREQADRQEQHTKLNYLDEIEKKVRKGKRAT